MLTTVNYRKKILMMSNKRLIIVTLFLLAFNVLFAIVIHDISDAGGYHLNGEYIEPHSPELILLQIRGMIISIPILCLFIGAVVAIFINKQLPYKKRYLRGVFLTIVVVYFFLLIAEIYKVISLLNK